KAFAARAKREKDKAFTDCTASEREAIVKGLDTTKSGDADLDYFFTITKKLAVQAYTTSEYFLTKVQEYKLVPGPSYGCV
ncbi:gluconate 2-dehydrogenase subunit 3 family protein, partial [Klebsiella pneumoniae]|nr:gluconate 2-dehydrogenase subunit 3 family protein [Klebsiella pneumoniae]